MKFGCASLGQKIQTHIHDLMSASKESVSDVADVWSDSDNPGLEPVNDLEEVMSISMLTWRS